MYKTDQFTTDNLIKFYIAGVERERKKKPQLWDSDYHYEVTLPINGSEALGAKDRRPSSDLRTKTCAVRISKPVTSWHLFPTLIKFRMNRRWEKVLMGLVTETPSDKTNYTLSTRNSPLYNQSHAPATITEQLKTKSKVVGPSGT